MSGLYKELVSSVRALGTDCREKWQRSCGFEGMQSMLDIQG